MKPKAPRTIPMQNGHEYTLDEALTNGVCRECGKYLSRTSFLGDTSVSYGAVCCRLRYSAWVETARIEIEEE